jgi:electron-transferring-flavoprotein dehydrogenase
MGRHRRGQGVNVFPGFSGVDLLWEGDRARRAHGRQGHRQGRLSPRTTSSRASTSRPRSRSSARARAGHLARKLIERRQLDAGKQPDGLRDRGARRSSSSRPGTVKDGFAIHGLGYPLDMKTFGGSFLYSMGGDKACIGLLVALDAARPA